MYTLRRTAQFVELIEMFQHQRFEIMQYRMEESSKNNVNTDQTVFVGHTEKNKSHSDEVTIMLTKEAEKALIN